MLCGRCFTVGIFTSMEICQESDVLRLDFPSVRTMLVRMSKDTKVHEGGGFILVLLARSILKRGTFHCLHSSRAPQTPPHTYPPASLVGHCRPLRNYPESQENLPLSDSHVQA
jgi:hypothetical protein